MNDDFSLADARVHNCAQRLLEEGVDPGIAADALLTEALALFSAHHRMPHTARGLAGVWTAIREAIDGR